MDKEDPQLSIVGFPKGDALGYGAPEVLELTILTAANLISLVLMWWSQNWELLSAIPEQLISMGIGFSVGALSIVTGYNELTVDVTYNFSGIFFEFFLPCMVFANAYSVKRKAFFRNWGIILCFCVLGTALSSVFIGYTVHTVVVNDFIKVSHNLTNQTFSVITNRPVHTAHPGEMPLVDCLVLGAMLSAVDPSSAFRFLTLDTDEQLRALLFGESVLNSAIAIVIYNGFRMYHAVLVERGPYVDDEMETADLDNLVMRFFVITFLSALMGISVGLVSALCMKCFHHSLNPSKEQAMMFLFAYLSYLVPRQLKLSPVVSLFLCGTTMAHYTFHNMSRMSQVASATWFRSIGLVSETFVFVFIGASGVIVKQSEWRFDLIGVLIFFCIASRVFIVVFLSNLINLIKWIKIQLRIDTREPSYFTWRAQAYLSWSGLRGAVAFALGMHSPILNEKGQMLTTTISVVVFTFVVQGCTLRRLAVLLKLAYDPQREALESGEKQRRFALIDAHNLNYSSILSYEDSPSMVYSDSSTSLLKRTNTSRPYGTFASRWRMFDERYMKPIFGGSARSVDVDLQQQVSALEGRSFRSSSGAERQQQPELVVPSDDSGLGFVK